MKKSKGWRNEPLRHSLASKGVKTGSKRSVKKVSAKGGNKVNSTNLVNYIMSYEDGSLNDHDVLELFSYLIKTGQAWQLQGSIYGRPAKQLIDSGLISKTGKINWSEYKKLKHYDITYDLK